MKFVPAIVVLFGLCLPGGAADTKKDDGAAEFRGAIADETLMKALPENGVIASEKAMEKLAKAWGVKAPKVDFDKEIVVVGVTSGSRINGRPQLKAGDLRIAFLSTRDLVPGFRYLMIVHPRDGVKTVNGKDLPKE